MNVAQSSHRGNYAMEAEELEIGEGAGEEGDKEQALDDTAAVSADEAAPLPAEVNVAIAECFRMEQISDSLEDLAVIADGIEEASPEEVALIRTVSDMAVAGTDVQSEEIVPETVVPLQLEVSGAAGNVVTEGRFIGRRISTEGIRETAKSIWEAIKKFLKDIWAKIETFFYKIFGTIPMLRRKVEALKKRADDLGSSGKTPGKEKITISSGVAALSKDYTPVATAAGLSGCIDDLAAAAKGIYGGYADRLVSLGDDMADIIGDFEPAAKQTSIDKMTALLLKNTLAKSPLFSGSIGSRFPGYGGKVSGQLLGNIVIAYKVKEIGATDTADNSANRITNLITIANFEIKVENAREKTGTVKDDFTMTPFHASDIEDMCSKMLKLLDQLEDFKRGSALKKILTAKEKMKKAADKAESSMGKMKDDATDKAAVPTYRALINTNTSFAKWASSPMMQFYRHCITEINAIVAVSSRSLSTYTSK